MELWYVFHPSRPQARHARIIEDLLELVEAGYEEAVDAIVGMLDDLYQNGRESRYLFSLKGYPIWELKTAARGGLKGGARVYLFITKSDRAVLVNCEVKTGKEADGAKLEEVLEIIAAYQQGLNVVSQTAQSEEQDA